MTTTAGVQPLQAPLPMRSLAMPAPTAALAPCALAWTLPVCLVLPSATPLHHPLFAAGREEKKSSSVAANRSTLALGPKWDRVDAMGPRWAAGAAGAPNWKSFPAISAVPSRMPTEIATSAKRLVVHVVVALQKGRRRRVAPLVHREVFFFACAAEPAKAEAVSSGLESGALRLAAVARHGRVKAKEA